jgi:hypothetical protein
MIPGVEHAIDSDPGSKVADCSSGDHCDRYARQGLEVGTYWHTALGPGPGWRLDPKDTAKFGENAKYYQHNVEEAKKLLAAAGYGKGIEVPTSYIRGTELGADFQRTVEKHAGTNMGWFFNQWVYGTEVPSYTCSYKVTPTPEGKFLLTCRIDQSNVPEDFRMHLPMRIDFGKAGVTRGRRLVQGPRTQFELLLPSKPDDVVFNDLESVLCEIKEADWE